VHRNRTERPDGDGKEMILTGFDTGKLRGFLDDYERYRGPAALDTYHPSRLIADTIEGLDS
jgi:UDP-N-acetylglucosamine 2-epimerase (non-hydrolysing)